MDAAIYARYSSGRQSAASIEDQVRLCRDLLDREGGALVQTYADAAVSGATLLRPGIQALTADAMAARVDIVVAEAHDRISRDQADVATVVKRLRFAGIRLVTLAEGEITELHVGLKGTMNALYLKDLADKTRRGLRGRVADGRSGGGNSYGYRLVGGETGVRVIDEVEAAVVRRVFRAYAAGQSPRAIAQGLNRARVPGPRGRAWGPSTLNGNAARGTGLLNNELYVGQRVWNRLRYVKDPETGRRVSRLNPEAEWIVTDLPDLRIVDDTLWQVVKDRQAAVKRNTRPDKPSDDAAPPWDRRRPRTLLSGVLVCGTCSGGFSKISRHRYGCSTARTKATCANRRTLRRDAVEAQVLDGLRHPLMVPDLFKAFCEEFHAELNRRRGTARADLGARRRERETVQRQARKLVEGSRTARRPGWCVTN